MDMVTAKQYSIVGIIFNERSAIDDVEVCQDFINLKWSRSELYSDIQAGVLPPGTIIQTPSDKCFIVSLKGDKYFLSSIKIDRRQNEPNID